jgi:hypothetical protein
VCSCVRGSAFACACRFTGVVGGRGPRELVEGGNNVFPTHHPPPPQTSICGRVLGGAVLFDLFNLSGTGTMVVDEVVLALRSVSVGLIKAAGGMYPLEVDLEAIALLVSGPRRPKGTPVQLPRVWRRLARESALASCVCLCLTSWWAQRAAWTGSSLSHSACTTVRFCHGCGTMKTAWTALTRGT